MDQWQTFKRGFLVSLSFLCLSHLPLSFNVSVITTLYLRWLCSLLFPPTPVRLFLWPLKLVQFCLILFYYSRPQWSDRSNSRQGHISLWDIEQGRGKKWVGSLGGENERHITAHYSAEEWQDDDAVRTGWSSTEWQRDACATHAYTWAHVRWITLVHDPLRPDGVKSAERLILE